MLEQTRNISTGLYKVIGVMLLAAALLVSPLMLKQVEANEDFRRLKVNSYERNLMARAVYSEARGEPYEGQVAVASVIINRVLDERFPGTVEEVIFEPWAFTAVHDGQFWLDPDPQILKPIEDALKGWDPSGGAVFYYNPVKVTSYWIFSRQVIDVIGRHYFAI